MSKLDKILSELPAFAGKVLPGFKFTFGMAYHSKDNLFQLSMFRDYGHHDGPMFFLQGSGTSTEDAANDLLSKFVTWCADQLTKQHKELADAQARLMAQMTTTESVAIEVEMLKNETMDN